MSLEQELKDIARAEAEKNKVVFPDVQKVEVTNLPEQKEPVVNVNVPDVKVPPINVPTPQVTVETKEVVVEQTDLTELAGMMEKQAALLNRIAEKPQSEFDYERFEQIAKANKSTLY